MQTSDCGVSITRKGGSYALSQKSLTYGALSNDISPDITMTLKILRGVAWVPKQIYQNWSGNFACEPVYPRKNSLQSWGLPFLPSTDGRMDAPIHHLWRCRNCRIYFFKWEKMGKLFLRNTFQTSSEISLSGDEYYWLHFLHVTLA